MEFISSCETDNKLTIQQVLVNVKYSHLLIYGLIHHVLMYYKVKVDWIPSIYPLVCEGNSCIWIIVIVGQNYSGMFVLWKWKYTDIHQKSFSGLRKSFSTSMKLPQVKLQVNQDNWIFFLWSQSRGFQTGVRGPPEGFKGSPENFRE